MLPIQRKPISFNYTNSTDERLYIVIHDTGNKNSGSNALAHYELFNSGDKQSSANYFVDDSNIIETVDPNSRYSWHCGDGNGKYGITNRNSIGIEICINSDGNYDVAVKNAIELTQYLMQAFNISIDKVVRHYDASRKNCPGTMSDNNWEKWSWFKLQLQNKLPEGFNEQFYLYANLDIKQAVESKVFSNGASHYVEYGYKDIPTRIYKPTLPLDFKEEGYLALNGDIKKAVELKQIPSGSWHWLIQGWTEGRPYKYDNNPPKFYETEHDEIEEPTPIVEVKTPIMGNATAMVEQAQEWARSKSAPQEFIDLAPLYWKIWTERAGLNPVIGYAQFAHETGYLYKVPSAAGVDASFKNPCGLKISQGGGDYEANAHKRFASWEEGITAHCDHMALYVGVNGYPKIDTPDPRHFSFIFGTAKYVEDLSAKWAPSTEYASKLLKFKKEIEETIAPIVQEPVVEIPTEIPQEPQEDFKAQIKTKLDMINILSNQIILLLEKL
jgi:N-acetyl-anhydromuramyl-L-alanine amidase AmpD